MPSRLFTPTFIALATATLVFYVANGIVIAAAPVFGGIGLGLSKGLVGIAIAIFSVAAIASRPIVGWSTDRFGRRRALMIGGTLTVAGLLAHVAASNVWLFIAARCILGVGEAFWLVAAVAAAADLAPAGRQGESLSFMSLTLYVGLAIGPAIAETILGMTGSFPIVWAVTAAIAAIGVGLARLVPETTPTASGPAPDRSAAAEGEVLGRPRSRPRLFHPAGVLPGLVILLGLSGMAYYLSFLPLYARTIGLEGASLPLAEYGVIVVVLRIVGARLPDRFGAVRLSGTALIASAVGLMIVAAVQTLTGLLVGTALFAIGVAFIMPAMLSLTVSRVPPEERGTVVGTATLFIDVSFGIAPVALGAVAEAGGYALGFLVGGAVSALGCIVLVAAFRAPRSSAATQGRVT